MNGEYTIEDIEKFLDATYKIQNSPLIVSLKKLLSVKDKIEIFKGISNVELKAIVYDVKFQKYQYKEFIISEGDESKEIFFILNGECQVFKDKKKIATLKPGTAFGEIGVIFETRRTADVICSSKETTLLSFKLDQTNFDFCAPALAKIYKNLAFSISQKLDKLNVAFIQK
jgi:CRP-like cAMP-binding protein